MRRLPSLDTLRAFEAVARHSSFTRAARELHVTQSALSQRIAALEAELGFRLFVRKGRTLTITAAGRRIAAATARALAEVGRAFEDIDGAEPARSLSVNVLPSFASRWLLPRLPRFHAQHSTLRVQIVAEGNLVDLQQSDADLAIRFGSGPYPGLHVEKLMGDEVIPVASPTLLAGRKPPQTAGELLTLPLLFDSAVDHDESGTDWRSWLAHVGADHAPLPDGPRFSQADLLLQAAAQGLGVALARRSLVADDLASGKLVSLLSHAPLRARYSYYLVCLPERAQRPPVAAFGRWLREETRAFDSRLEEAMAR
jgi:LysR family glycine cleavage system transcriptional activator